MFKKNNISVFVTSRSARESKRNVTYIQGNAKELEFLTEICQRRWDAIIDFMKREKERGKTVLYSTHYMEEAEYLCDRIVVINMGRIIGSGKRIQEKKSSN